MLVVGSFFGNYDGQSLVPKKIHPCSFLEHWIQHFQPSTTDRYPVRSART